MRIPDHVPVSQVSSLRAKERRNKKDKKDPKQRVENKNCLRIILTRIQDFNTREEGEGEEGHSNLQMESG